MPTDIDANHRLGSPWPALGAFAAAATGCLAASATTSVTQTWWLGAATVAAVLAGLTRGRPSAAALALAATLLAGGWFSMRINTPMSRTPTEATGRRALVTARGVALDDPVNGPPTPGAFARFVNTPPVSRFTLDVDQLRDGDGKRRMTGKLLVRVNETIVGVRAGDRVRVSGFFTSIRSPSSPGEPDARRLAAQEGILGRLIAPGRDNIQRISGGGSLFDSARRSSLRWGSTLRARSSAWLDAAVARPGADDDPGRAVLSALLLGQRDDNALRELSVSMRRIGVAHLLSISGLHLGVLVWLAVVALRALGVRAGIETALVALLVILYMIVVPARTPIVRAGVMALAFLAAETTGRRHHPLAVLAWTGVGVLLWRPLDLFSPGFQLSFGVVAAIIVAPPILMRRLNPIQPDPGAMRGVDGVRLRLGMALLVALCAWAVAAPIVVYHFGVLSLVGVVASVLLLPVVVFVLGVGVVALLVSAALPSVSMLAGGVLTASGRLLAGVVFALDALPGSSIRLPPVSVWWTIAALGVAAWWLVGGSWRRWRDVGLAGLIVVWLVGFALTPTLDRATALRIDTLDVDDGACHLIRSGRDAVLWDCGSRLLWLGERSIPRTLRALGVWRVHTIVLSHPNLDHYSAIPDVIGPFGVEQVLVGPATIRQAEVNPAGPVADLLDELDRKGVSVRVVRASDRLAIGAARLEFLHPRSNESASTANDSSLVAEVRIDTASGVRGALFTGDIERKAIREIQDDFPDLRADLMEAPHHGSARPSAFGFVEQVNPSIVIQSTGPSRVDDERWARARAGRSWFTTASDGAVRVVFGKDGSINTSAFRQPTRILVKAGAGTATDTPR